MAPVIAHLLPCAVFSIFPAKGLSSLRIGTCATWRVRM
jgi:hypothetical protein